METFEVVLTVLALIVLFLILTPKIQKKRAKVGHKDLDENPFEESKEEKIEKIVLTILTEAREKRTSFMKILEETQIPDDIAVFSIVARILDEVKILYFDELIDLLKADYKKILPEEINIKKRTKTYPSEPEFFYDEDEILYAIDKIGLKAIFPLIKDENFKDGNSLKVFQKVEEKFSTDYFIVKYFCEGDGQKHWDNPEAQGLLILALIELTGVSETELNNEEIALLEKFSQEHQIVTDFCEDYDDYFLENLSKYDKSALGKIFEHLSIEDEYYVLPMMERDSDAFMLWLEKTPKIIDNGLFNYLVWNNLLPERFKEDERYKIAEATLQAYKPPVIDLNAIKDVKSNENLVAYVKLNNIETFVYNCINRERFVPCLFWYEYEFENSQWKKMSEQKAQNILDNYNSLYVFLSYVLEEYKLEASSHNKFFTNCSQETIFLAQLYFELHHKKLFV
ncbi:MAG: hypothetical protein PHE89_07530 [Alphaproteobacteria bacterium]|nr:hypothetical protein [Alphaproteobacteria bacterium]